MKKLIIVTLHLFFVTFILAQNPFINTYDSTKLFYPKDIAFTSLGEIVVCAAAWDSDLLFCNNYIYKIDENGNLLNKWWEKDMSIEYKQASNLLIVEDEIYLFGFIDSNPAVFMKKFDQNLNELGEFVFNLDDSLFTGIHHTCRAKYYNDSFIFFSSVYLNDPYDIRVSPFLMEITTDGQLTTFLNDKDAIYWHFLYDFHIKPDNQGYYAFIGEHSPSVNPLSGFIYDYNNYLELTDKIELPYNFKRFFTVQFLDESLCYVSGCYKNPAPFSNQQVGVSCLTSDFEEVYTYLSEPLADSTSYTAYYNSLDMLSDGSLILCSTYGFIGLPQVPQNAPSWISLFKLSPDLELLWHRYIGGGANYEAYTMRVAPDDGIVICAGYSPVPPSSMIIKDLMVIKTDSDGLTTSLNDVTPAVTTTEAILFPVPAGDFVVVDFSLLYKTATLQLTDLAGRAVLERALTANHQQVDITGVPAGAYVYRIFNNKGLEESGKLVVE
jgi:hypothetical protein